LKQHRVFVRRWAQAANVDLDEYGDVKVAIVSGSYNPAAKLKRIGRSLTVIVFEWCLEGAKLRSSGTSN
jgi:hypothetical protein